VVSKALDQLGERGTGGHRERPNGMNIELQIRTDDPPELERITDKVRAFPAVKPGLVRLPELAN